MVYEGLLVFGVVFSATFIFSLLTQKFDPTNLRFVRELFLFIVLGFYFVFSWRRSGQTLAMKTWKIRLVDSTNSPLPLMKAIIRYCFAWMWFLPAIMIAYQLELQRGQVFIAMSIGIIAWALTALIDKDRQFLHDRWAKTRLIQEPRHANTDSSVS